MVGSERHEKEEERDKSVRVRVTSPDTAGLKNEEGEGAEKIWVVSGSQKWLSSENKRGNENLCPTTFIKELNSANSLNEEPDEENRSSPTASREEYSLPTP